MANRFLASCRLLGWTEHRYSISGNSNVISSDGFTGDSTTVATEIFKPEFHMRIYLSSKPSRRPAVEALIEVGFEHGGQPGRDTN